MKVKKEYNKYLVLKRFDIQFLLSADRYKLFKALVNKIEDNRKRLISNKLWNGKRNNKYIICNQDEPYAEKVWKIILEGEKLKAGE